MEFDKASMLICDAREQSARVVGEEHPTTLTATAREAQALAVRGQTAETDTPERTLGPLKQLHDLGVQASGGDRHVRRSPGGVREA